MDSLSLEHLQYIVETWFDENQGAVESNEAILIVQREMGKLVDSHMRLNRASSSERTKWERTTQKKLGDVIIALARYCGSKKWGVDECTEGAVHILTDRTWKEFSYMKKHKSLVSPKAKIKVTRKPKRMSSYQPTASKKPTPQKMGQVLPFRFRDGQGEQSVPDLQNLEEKQDADQATPTLDPKDPLNVALTALGMIIQGGKFVKEDGTDIDDLMDEDEE